MYFPWPKHEKTEGFPSVFSCSLFDPIYVVSLPFFSIRQIAFGITENADGDIVYFYRNERNTVRYRGKQIFLSESEAKLLLALCQSSPEPVSREILGGLLESGQGNIVDVYICKLRKKLEEPFSTRLIFTVRNKGYKIMADMEWE